MKRPKPTFKPAPGLRPGDIAFTWEDSKGQQFEAVVITNTAKVFYTRSRKIQRAHTPR